MHSTISGKETIMPTVADAPVFLTVAEAAALIRVNKRTILNRIHAGRLPAKRLTGGRAVIIEQQDVLSLLEDVLKPSTQDLGAQQQV